jgi:hypothetical protein
MQADTPSISAPCRLSACANIIVRCHCRHAAGIKCSLLLQAAHAVVPLHGVGAPPRTALPAARLDLICQRPLSWRSVSVPSRPSASVSDQLRPYSASAPRDAAFCTTPRNQSPGCSCERSASLLAPPGAASRLWCTPLRRLQRPCRRS